MLKSSECWLAINKIGTAGREIPFQPRADISFSHILNSASIAVRNKYADMFV